MYVCSVCMYGCMYGMYVCKCVYVILRMYVCYVNMCVRYVMYVCACVRRVCMVCVYGMHVGMYLCNVRYVVFVCMYAKCVYVCMHE